MGLLLDDLYDHEGYADRRLPDGRLAGGVWTHQTRAFTGYVAACGCGWHASTDYPPTEEGDQDAVDQWRREHAEPLLARQADRRRAELARVLAWLGSQADQLTDPPALGRIAHGLDRAGQLVQDVQRDHERRALAREAGGER
jgi:hypothetical protein